MKKEISSQNWQPVIEQLEKFPEFRFADGGLFKKLEYACYYNVGGLCFPAHLLLSHYLQMLAGKVLVQDVQFVIIGEAANKIVADAAVMAQDVNRIIGPVDAYLDEMDYNEPIEQLKNFRPSPLGKILISSPRWCRAGYLLEAVVYDFEAKNITSKKNGQKDFTGCVEKIA